MIKPTAPSRPPGQYVVAKGTQFRLVANQYDKNTYAQCSYVSQRTLIRCKQIRPKEELSKNSGKCEEHDQFCEILRASRNKEMLRIRAECDNVNSRRRRLNSFVITNDYISDEEDFLQNLSSTPSQLPDKIYDNTIDSDPLRHAGVFTEKDILRRRLDYIRKDISDLNDFGEMLEAVTVKMYEKEMEDSSKSVMIDPAQLRAYEAIQDSHRKDYPRPTRLFRSISETPKKYCKYQSEIPDSEVARQVVEKLLNDTVGRKSADYIGPCENKAVLKNDYCMEHIFLDKTQSLFANCTICGVTAVATDEPTCTFHMKELARYRCVDPQYNVRKGEEDVKSRLSVNDVLEAQKNQSNGPRRYVIDESDDETESTLANLAHIENMPSPLSALGMGFGQQPRRPAPLYVNTGPTQRAAQQRYLQQQEELMAEERNRNENEIKSQTCARERPFKREYFNKGEPVKTAPQKTTIITHAPTPRVLPSSSTQRPIFHQTYTPRTTIPIQTSFPHHSRYSSTHQFVPTKFPISSSQRRGVHPVPIPLERQGCEQESRVQRESRQVGEIDDLVEDRKTPPVISFGQEPIQYKRLEKNVPRGIPYVKHGTSFRRTDGTEISPTQQPIAPHRLQMAPHREIAARQGKIEPSTLATSSFPSLSVTRDRQIFQASRYEIAKDAPPVVHGADPQMDVKSYLQQIGAAKEIEDRVVSISQANKFEEAERERISTAVNANISSPNRAIPTIIQKVAIIKSPARSKINESPLGRPPKLAATLDKPKLAPQPGPSVEPANVVEQPAEDKKEEIVNPLDKVETPRKAPIPQPLQKESPVKNTNERKRKTTSGEEPEPKRKAPRESPKKETSTRTPRAAAIAANQAMNTKTTPKTLTPSQSKSSSSTQQETAYLDPLSVLAAVSEIERVREECSKSSSVSPKSSVSKSSEKTASSTPSSVPRRSSRTQKSEDDPQKP